ncbi:hypothetical protein [Trujillonella endophytica]|uniref:Uncharacterized protein n=1 Tax=Trujillonella endophytica TaxID=673521 RepID=A0A1H8Q2E1_9ACTN|nr:hypothetical protein [Trujillella endophytica]SEO48415.1 hypothetical protein SAMN05660991_00534 [Trujillella endophytica]
MTDVSAVPGDLTVPLLTGWELVAGGLVLLLVLVAAVVVLGASRAGRGERADWEAWLDGRSRRADDAAPGSEERVARTAG